MSVLFFFPQTPSGYQPRGILANLTISWGGLRQARGDSFLASRPRTLFPLHVELYVDRGALAFVWLCRGRSPSSSKTGVGKGMELSHKEAFCLVEEVVVKLI